MKLFPKHKAEARLEALYNEIIRQATLLVKNIKLKEGQIFQFKDFPQIESQINRLIDELNAKSITILEKATEEEWNDSIEKNNKLITPYLKRGLLTSEQITAYTSRNLEGLRAFQKRKYDGLGLSDRVWKYSKQFKSEIEMGLDLGIREGKSAQRMSQVFRSYLQEPNRLFRRVRDAHGVLHLSKNAKNYHPGQGVYRSSFKNALRLTRTETNMAYRTADIEKFQQFDFVIGYEVRRSNRVCDCSVCESLKGKYPKTFKFVGWHPNCLCYLVPILMPLEDFAEMVEVKNEGKEYVYKKTIKDVPQNFKTWVKDNQDRIRRAKSLPYFLRDNRRFWDVDVDKQKVKDLVKDLKKHHKGVIKTKRFNKVLVSKTGIDKTQNINRGDYKAQITSLNEIKNLKKHLDGYNGDIEIKQPNDPKKQEKRGTLIGYATIKTNGLVICLEIDKTIKEGYKFYYIKKETP